MHTKKIAYGIDILEEEAEKNKTLDEHKHAMKKGLSQNLDKDISNQGQPISSEDVDTFFVKEDEKIEFGLQIKSRIH